MKNKQAFTLIELLIVVLIIGILAAVALPQYQKAVAKSRFAALKPIAKSIKDAEEIYYNEHGNYGALADLDVQAPAGSVSVSETTGHDYVRASSSSGNRYTVYFNHSDNFAGNVYCEAEKDNTIAEAVCVAEQGVDTELVQDGHKLYLMSGSGTGSFPYKLMSKTGSYPYYTYTYSNGTETIKVLDWGNILMINGVSYSASPSSDNQLPPDRAFAVLCERYSFIEACN